MLCLYLYIYIYWFHHLYILSVFTGSSWTLHTKFLSHFLSTLVQLARFIPFSFEILILLVFIFKFECIFQNAHISRIQTRTQTAFKKYKITNHFYTRVKDETFWGIACHASVHRAAFWTCRQHRDQTISIRNSG
jgi:hypothetical protein